MKDFLKRFPFRKFSIFLTVVGTFTYNILLDRDVTCTCKDVAQECTIYMTLPFLIIFFLMLWTDKTLERTCKYTFLCERKKPERNNQVLCGHVRKQLCGVFIIHIFKAISVGLLWVVSVFIDGDWYVCCQSGTEESELACKDEINITAQENVIISSLKNQSRHIGFFLLFAIVSLATLTSLRVCHICHCSRRATYDLVILEEGEKLLKEIIKEATRDELMKNIFEKIDGDVTQNEGENNWIKDLDVAAKMIQSSAKPKLSKSQKQQCTEAEEAGEAGGAVVMLAEGVS
ncbi:unnamed protein product [Oreochromis niloticus]|nr:unnamed protein product [Mustela putorius furo]